MRAIFARASTTRAAQPPRAPTTAGAMPALDDLHHRKLVDALKAVLNYRLGNEPSSIDRLVPVHRNREIGAAHFQAFTDCFIQTLTDSMRGGADAPAHTPAGTLADRPADTQDIVAAWLALFAPVIEELKRRVVA